MINLNDTTPAPPGGKANIKWQKDTTGNVSGYVDSVGSLFAIPGPYADDTAAAAAGVAIGSPYYLTTSNYVVVRTV